MRGFVFHGRSLGFRSAFPTTKAPPYLIMFGHVPTATLEALRQMHEAELERQRRQMASLQSAFDGLADTFRRMNEAVRAAFVDVGWDYPHTRNAGLPSQPPQGKWRDVLPSNLRRLR